MRRYKRFLADVQLDNGEIITAYCPNTGRMTACSEPGWRSALSYSDNPVRKHRYTLEMTHNDTCWIGIHSSLANRIVEQAITAHTIPELDGYSDLLRERRYGMNSRIDLLLQSDTRPECYVEIKNVTLRMPDGTAAFPDAVSSRGLKHLHELARMVQAGHRAVMMYLIQRTDCRCFRPAHEIDPAYCTALQQAVDAGVELLAYEAEVSPKQICIRKPVSSLI